LRHVQIVSGADLSGILAAERHSKFAGNTPLA
jgi:hypothetical protein